MGLFSKKDCSFCGAQCGVLSCRKLADGFICKDCRSRLSPYYDVSTRDTVAGIAAQLDYRQRNLAELARFRPAVVAGGAGKVFIDMQMGKFAVCRERELREGNPDLFDLRGLQSCTLRVREHRDRGVEDEPDRYEYDFFLDFAVDHPFVRKFSYEYNGTTVICGHRIRESEAQQIYYGQREIKTGFSAMLSGVNRKAMEAYVNQYANGQDMVEALRQAAAAARSGQVFQQPVYQPPVYQPVYQQPTYQQPAAPQPAAPAVNFCPNCGARVSGGAFCPSCGSRL